MYNVRKQSLRALLQYISSDVNAFEQFVLCECDARVILSISCFYSGSKTLLILCMFSYLASIPIFSSETWKLNLPHEF